MEHAWKFGICGLAVSGLVASGIVSAWAFEFSAERIAKVQKTVVVSHVNAKDDRWRFEYQYPQAGVMAAIVRQDRQVVWLLLSKRRLYLEVPIAPEHALFVSETMEGEVSRERIGTEDLNGHATELFEITVMDQETRKQYYQWVTIAQRFPIKTVSKQGDWSVEYRRIVFTEQSGLIFELPQRFDRGNPMPSSEVPPSAREPTGLILRH